MKPKFKAEIKQLEDMRSGLSEEESPDIKKLNQFGVKLIQNLRFCYENASLANKQKLVGSIFPENFTIENNECRTARENEVILALKVLPGIIKRKNLTDSQVFPPSTPDH